jgi:hypothetical protein
MLIILYLTNKKNMQYYYTGVMWMYTLKKLVCLHEIHNSIIKNNIQNN